MAELQIQNHHDLVRDWWRYTAILDCMSSDIFRMWKYLVMHRSESDGTSEGKQNYENRVRRLYRVNHCSPYVFIHWSHMAQNLAVGGADNPLLAPIIDDTSGYGTSATKTSRDRMFRYIRDGKVGTLVDSPAVIASDRATARAAGERSYQVIYTARDIRNWTYFTEGPRKGQFKEVLLVEPSVGPKGQEQFRRLVQEDSENAMFQWQLLQAKQEPSRSIFGVESNLTNPTILLKLDPQTADIIDSGEGGLTKIPFVLFGTGADESFLADVWPLDLAVMNLTSVLSNIVYNTGFQRSAFAGVAPEEVQKIAEYTVTLLRDPQAKIFTINPGDPKACFDEKAILERQIDRRAKFEFNQMADDTRQVQSAESKTKDLIVRQAIYNATLDELERKEKQIYQLHAEYEGVNPDDISVSIGREFGLDDEQLEITRNALLFNQAGEIGATALRKEMLKLEVSLKRFLPNKDENEEEVRQRIIDDIEKASGQGQNQIADLTSGIFKRPL